MQRFLDPDQAIHVSEGDRFAVALEGNPTTGYTWHFVSDERYLERLDQDFEPHGAGIGAGGKEIVVFRALTAGLTTITCEYRRPWDQQARSIVSFEVQIE